MEIMNKLMSAVQFVLTNYGEILNAGYAVVSALTSLCAALIAVFLMIPGEQPEKAIGSFRDFISKFSKK